jgi:hypothetical protein
LLGVLLASFASAGCPQLLDDSFSTLAAPPPRDAGHGGREPTGNDTVPPRLLSTTPNDGARGVPSDVVIELTFSEPMDTEATIGAYTSTDLPAASLRFSWRAGNTVLVMQPRQPLPRASGTDLASVTALEYSFQIGARARDVAGNPLASAPAVVAFTTAREIVQSFETVKDRNLTGNWRGDNVYGAVDCERVDTSICVGDGLNITEFPYRGFLSFDLAALPDDHIGIDSAELSLSITSIFNTPFDLGGLGVEQVSFASIDADSYQQNREASLGTLTTGALIGQVVRLDVSASVEARAGGLSQYRLRFDSDTNSDGGVDIVICDWTTPRLSITYLTP